MALYVGLDVFTKNDVNLRRRSGWLAGMGRQSRERAGPVGQGAFALAGQNRSRRNRSLSAFRMALRRIG